MATVLLEIGVEEMPAGYLPPTLMQVAEIARARLSAERIAFEDLRTWGTPRRIVLYLTGIVERQAPAVREVRGPAVHDAFAANGEPTPAAIGFARSHGVPVTELRIRKIEGGEYVVVVFRDEGRPTFELLPSVFTSLISSLKFPQMMRWDSGNFRFARPIRWIVALMDDQVVPFTIDAVTAGRLTRGHRFLAPGGVDIPSATHYQRIMDENQVIVDQDVRRESIRQQLAALVQQDNAVILDDGTLLDMTTFSVEYPTALRGTFDENFLSLPDEVLLQVLRHEQQFFPLTDTNNSLLPAFITVRDGDKSYLGTVREGYEGVARAKLLDALFFFEQDCQQVLADRVPALHGVIFQENLGTMLDKTKRVESLAGLIAAWLDYTPEDRQFAERAALLAKADLVTAMVMEHPQLQGTMGKIYAQISGEPSSVVTAIDEQYQPRSAADSIPASPLGRVVALADKLDTVVACFAIGITPKDGEDPYDLREKADGVVRILAEGHLPLSLSQLIARALRQITVETSQPREEIQGMLERFFRKRLARDFTSRGIAQP
ncbi:MAG TPA: glycine--tRNA ligase subunit beta, partial [Armatimonadota bacterium]|nr:glycine--tRNA ligase subunit beta [Armatimonadota bacterium]